MTLNFIIIYLNVIMKIIYMIQLMSKKIFGTIKIKGKGS